MAKMAGMAGMAERQKEWQNGKMAEMDTYVLFMVHADGMAEWRMEWQNGGMADGMVEWLNGGNGRMARMAGMAGMAERQKEWHNGRKAEMDTYVLFMVHAKTNTDDETFKSFIV